MSHVSGQDGECIDSTRVVVRTASKEPVASWKLRESVVTMRENYEVDHILVLLRTQHGCSARKWDRHVCTVVWYKR